MTKQVSDCHGADVYWVRGWVEHNGIGHTAGNFYYCCTKCHKPCLVAKEKEDAKK